MKNMIASGLKSLGGLLRMAWLCCWVALIVPWVVIGVLQAAFIRARRLAWILRAVPRAAGDALPCPRGHASELLGVFECRGCGGLYAGHAFQRCPICGSSAGHIMCEHCGLTIRNPMT